MSEKKYNLLFIFADQWRRSAVGFMGMEDVYSPNVDEFSRNSVIFNNAVSTAPLCSPSRASILTGTNPITHGVFTNCKLGLENVYLKENSTTILDVLSNNNYYVGYIGKWHLDNPEMNYNDNPKSGASHWDAYTPPGEKRHGVHYWYSYGAYDNHLKPHYWHNDEKMIEVDQWSVEHETDKALEFLRDNKDKTFSLFLSWNPPHTPLDLVPQKYIDIYKDKKLRVFNNVILNDVIDHTKTMDKPLNFNDDEFQDVLRKYYAAISGIDENFGRIIKYLKENDLYDNTIIVLSADHGELNCAHGLWSKHVWYEEAISVPFLIKYPNSRGINDTVLSGVDIMPTLLSLLNLEIPSSVEGKNLEKAVVNNEYIENYAFISAYPGAIKAIEKFKKENLNSLDYGWRAIKDKEYTYVVNKGYEPYLEVEKYLFNNIKDKTQLNNLVDKEIELSSKFENILKEYLNKYGDKFKI